MDPFGEDRHRNDSIILQEFPTTAVVCCYRRTLFVVTDPPIKALRRLIPPIRMGGVALDLSVLVLFFAIMIVQMILRYLI